MGPKTTNETTRLLSADNADGNRNRSQDVLGSPGSKKSQKAKSSDGSLDFERIVNSYSIQGELSKREQSKCFGIPVFLIISQLCKPFDRNRQPNERGRSRLIGDFLSTPWKP